MISLHLLIGIILALFASKIEAELTNDVPVLAHVVSGSKL